MANIQTLIGIGGGIIGLLAAALTIGVTVGRPLRRLAKQNEEFREDWYGEPARPGRAAVPGVPERLARIEQEFRTNGGGSLRDALNRVDAATQRVEARLDDHIRTHHGIPG